MKKKKLWVVTAIDETEMMTVIGIYSSAILARKESLKVPKHYAMIEISDHVLDETAIPQRSLQGRLNFTRNE